MRAPHRIISLAACVAPLLWSTASHAQAADVAKKLLAEAKQYKDAGNIAAACPLLDRAYEMDAKDGILFARADCRDMEGKIVAATSLYEAYLRAYSRMTGATKQSHAERAANAKARLEELAPLVPMVKFVWAEPPPPETKIIVDGIEFRASTLDVKLPLEPGTHEIVVKLPGEPDRKRTVTLAKGGSTIVDLTPLSPEALEKLKQANKPPEPVKAPPSPKRPKDTKQSVDPIKVAGFVGAGLGVAGLVAGSITGGMAVQEKAIVDEHCNADKRCDPEGLAAADRFQTIGNVSTATFIAGGVLAGVGATLLVVAYRAPAGSATARVKTTVSPTGTFFGVEGAF